MGETAILRRVALAPRGPWPVKAMVVLRLVLGALFVYAGVIKALDLNGFAASIRHYDLVPYHYVTPLALYLVLQEILCGVCLMIRRACKSAVQVLLGLMIVFIAVLFSAWWRGIDITCGCFGTATASRTVAWPIVRDLVIFAGLLALYVKGSFHKTKA